jgi:hypothetical protein
MGEPLCLAEGTFSSDASNREKSAETLRLGITFRGDNVCFSVEQGIVKAEECRS